MASLLAPLLLLLILLFFASEERSRGVDTTGEWEAAGKGPPGRLGQVGGGGLGWMGLPALRCLPVL